jgi:hypothetical protein
MPDIDTRLAHLDTSTDHGIPVTVTAIHPYATYHSSWIDSPFFFETSRVRLVCDSPFGPLALDDAFNSADDTRLPRLLRECLAPDETFDVRALHEQTLYLVPRSDERAFGTLWSAAAPSNTYVQGQSVAITTLDDGASGALNPSARSLHRCGIEARELDWLTNQLAIEVERATTPHGWLERDIGSVTDDGSELRLSVPIRPGWDAHWTFASEYQGYQQFREVLTAFDLPQSHRELEGSRVYVHPTRCAAWNWTTPREALPRDRLDRWVLAPHPMETRGRSWWQRLKQRVAPSQPRLDVSVGRSSSSPSRPASSEHDATRDESRPPVVGPSRETLTDDPEAAVEAAPTY